MTATKSAPPPLNVQMIMAPVLLLSHLFGILFYFWRNHRILVYTYRTIMFAIHISSLINELPSINYWGEHANGLHGFIVKLDNFSWWLCYYGNFWITSLKNSQIYQVLDELENTGVSLASKTQIRIFKFHLTLTIVNVGLLVLYNILGHDFVWPNANHTVFSSTIYIVGDVTILIAFYQFSHMVNLIGELFKQVNDNFNNIKPNDSIDFKSSIFGLDAGEIASLRRSHLYLTIMCKKVNSCYSEQLVLIIYFSMVQAIYAVRSIIGDFSIKEIDESILNILSDTLWLLPYIVTVVQIIYFCEKTSSESRKSLTIAHHLMNIYYYDNGIMKELEIFVLQIQQNQIYFHVRFFELHYPFLNTLVSSLMTYFVVIATFQGESDEGGLVNWNFKPPTTVNPETTHSEFLP